MKVKFIASILTIGASITTTSTYAVWLDHNVQVKDGLSFGITADLRPSISKEVSTFKYIYGDPRIYDKKDKEGNLILGRLEQVLKDQDRRDLDEQLRLLDHQANGVFFIVNQQVNRDVNVGGYTYLYAVADKTQGDAAVYSYGLTVSHNKFGNLNLSSVANFDTSKVAHAGVFNELGDSGALMAITYKPTASLDMGGFYAFPAAADVRSQFDGGLHKGMGSWVAYKHYFAPRALIKTSVGIAKTEHLPDSVVYDNVAQEKLAYGAGLSYRYNDVLLDLDSTFSKKRFSSTFVNTADTRTHGIKLSYDVTPRLSTNISYGVAVTDKTAGTSIKALNFDAVNDPSRQRINEETVFKRINKQQYRLGVDYKLYDGMSLQGSITNQKTTNYLEEGAFSERNLRTYNAGFNFSF